MVSHRERVIRALRGEPTDRIPRGEFFIADEFVRAFLSLDAGTEIVHEHRAAVVEQLNLDIASVAFSAGWGALEQPDEDRALASLARWQAESDRFVFALIDGPFSAAVKARGFDTLMRYTRSAPQFAREEFQRGADQVRMIAQAVRDAGADGVILGEDIAYGRTTFISPADLHSLYFPALQQVVREIRTWGPVVFFHSDGNLNAILDDLTSCSLDGLQGLEPEAGMSLRTVREKIGHTMTLWGNVSFDFLSAARTEEAIGRVVRELVSQNNGKGSLIVGSCGGLVQGLDVETVRRFYRAIP